MTSIRSFFKKIKHYIKPYLKYFYMLKTNTNTNNVDEIRYEDIYGLHKKNEILFNDNELNKYNK